MKIKKSRTYTFLVALAITMMAFAGGLFASPKFTDTFMEERCHFSSTGRNPFFILEAGYELVLEGVEDGEAVRLVITVLDETKVINGVETRIVKERETHNGEVVEISKNYFAICKPTNSVFYFGEDVNIFENGEVVGHPGVWRAGVDGARAGIVMPGTLLLGARYHQEIADVAMDRAEIRRLDAVVSTPFAQFTDCLETKETTPLEPDAEEFKFYAPGVGLVKEDTLELVTITTASGTLYPQN